MSDTAFEVGPDPSNRTSRRNPALVRWMLRIVTVGLFGAATVAGVTLE
jgi:hypothetical protein